MFIAGFLFGLASGLIVAAIIWRHFWLEISDLKLKHKIWEE